MFIPHKPIRDYLDTSRIIDDGEKHYSVDVNNITLHEHTATELAELLMTNRHSITHMLIRDHDRTQKQVEILKMDYRTAKQERDPANLINDYRTRYYATVYTNDGKIHRHTQLTIKDILRILAILIDD